LKSESAESRDELEIEAKLARCGKLTHDEHFAEAEMECRAALVMAPNSSVLLSAVSFVLSREDKRDEALTFARRAADLDSSLATARFRVGGALEATGDLNGADTAYRQVLELESDNIDAMVALGSLAQKKHNLEAAMARFSEALRIQPNSVNAHYNLASALHERGDVNGERAELLEGVSLAPDFAEAHYHLGVVLQKKVSMKRQ
jgi:tetratricopeptide (TPR) repeat protein